MAGITPAFHEVVVDGGPRQTIHTFTAADSDGAYHLVDIDITPPLSGSSGI